MSRLGCADEAAFGERSDGEHSPTPSADTQTERQEVLGQWRGSVVAPPRLLAIGK